MTSHPDIPTLIVNGRAYYGWESIRVSRGIDRCVSDFRLEVSQRWTGQDTPWQILPFSACEVRIDDTPIILGYVDEYNPKISASEHGVEITGRSRTQDLVDCTPDVASGQFSGYTLAQTARSLAAIFGIEVVVQADAANTSTFADTQIERCETAFTFLERLGRLCGVLLSDDELGRLVLTTCGSTRASGSLIEGQNIQSATAKLSVEHRFSDYIVKGQHSLGVGGAGSWAGFGGGPTAPPLAGIVQTQQEATAHDPTVPRYRPRVVIAESQLTQAGMQMRANWLMHAAYGHSTKAEITVGGWRQPDGTLWTVNQLVPVWSSSLGVDQDLLIARVEFELSRQSGRTTKLHVGPVEGYTPDPGQVKVHKKRGKGSSCPSWQGFTALRR